MNQKGGVGKTTTAINLAAGLSRNDKRVLLIDLDPQGNVDSSLKTKSEYDLYDALIGVEAIHQCIVNVATNFDIITSKETLTKAEYYLARQEDSRMLLRDMLAKLNGYDYIIVDCPPSLGIINQNALAYCKEAFVPVSTDYLGYEALNKMQGIIKTINKNYGHDIKISKVIPTMFDKRLKECKTTLAQIQQDFPSQTTYPIRLNSKLKEAPRFGQSIFTYAKNSPGARDYGQLIEDVMSMNVKYEAKPVAQ